MPICLGGWQVRGTPGRELKETQLIDEDVTVGTFRRGHAEHVGVEPGRNAPWNPKVPHGSVASCSNVAHRDG